MYPLLPPDVLGGFSLRQAKGGRPFDVIFERAKKQEWWALADDFRTFLLGGLPELQTARLSGSWCNGVWVLKKSF